MSINTAIYLYTERRSGTCTRLVGVHISIRSLKKVTMTESSREIRLPRLEDEGYRIIRLLGSGTYGDVFLAKDARGEKVAIKRFMSSRANQGVPSDVLREVSSLKRLTHPNVIELLKVKAKGNYIYMIMQFMEFDLAGYMKRYDRPLPRPLVKSLMLQLFMGLDHIHSLMYMHRDLKPANLLVAQNGDIKISDFGLSRLSEFPVRHYTNEVITSHYKPPEILLGSEIYSFAVDIWSLGCIFAEMTQNRVLFNATGDIEMLRLIFSLFGTPTTKSWPGVDNLPLFHHVRILQFIGRPLSSAVPLMNAEGLDLLSHMVAMCPEKRIVARSGLKHPFLNDAKKVPLPPLY